jgi:hypothetical protein
VFALAHQLAAGVPTKVVSERIGHADPAVTMQVYAHALDGDDATAAELTAAAIFGDRSAPAETGAATRERGVTTRMVSRWCHGH